MKNKSIYIIVILFALVSFSFEDNHPKEKLVKAYYAGWENKDWGSIEKLLDPQFTFTSPAPDDHLSIAQFRARCWVQADYQPKFKYISIIESDTGAFVLYECTTKENTSFRNTEYFIFNGNKIRAIEVYFGSGGGYPSNAKVRP